jgi:hypothetical protein
MGTRFTSGTLTLCLVVVGLATPAAAAAAALSTASQRAPISASKALELPSASRCVRGHTLTFKVRQLTGVRWASATVKINGSLFKEVGAARLRQPVTLTGLPKGRFVLSVTVRASDGRSVTKSRTYRSCTAFPLAGSYSGGDSQGGSLAFYVSTNRHLLQDATVSDINLTCSNGSTPGDTGFSILQATIFASGSFSGSSRQSGFFSGSPATITYKLSGRFHHLDTASGELRENIKYISGGATVTCTSNNVSWNTTRGAQGSQARALPLVGGYAGGDAQGGSLAFYVSTDRRHLQDATVSDVNLTCSSGSTPGDTGFSIPQLMIAPSGSFSGSSTQRGFFSGSPATITYKVAGHFHGLDTSGQQIAAGQLRENVKYTSGGATVTCTSNNVSWNATRGAQGSQAKALPLAGSYTGGDAQGGSVSFQVSADRHHLQDATVSDVNLTCSDGSTPGDTGFSISHMTVASNGSFSGSSTQSGLFSGSPATITYKLAGHFHGLDTSGRQVAAGQLRENVKYTSGGATVTCSSNNLSWNATS